MDVLLCLREIVSSALRAMALWDRGVPASSFTGAEAGIVPDSQYGRARIRSVVPQRLRDCLANGHVAIVAGFQGVTESTEVTTLGRGGSDTTAVALFFFNDTATTEIYTDVEGIYTCD